MTYVLPKLPYDYEAFELHIDSETMKIHHTKHHQAYVDNLNKALEQSPNLKNIPLEDIMKNIHQISEAVKQAIINHGGGHLNHSLFWAILSPNGGGNPQGEIGKTIEKRFGNFEVFKEKFNQAAISRFGSGWAWLTVNSSGQLDVISTGNQDSPFMQQRVPILGLDVWEHAYYLKYQNRRLEYIQAFWQIVNWPEVERKYLEAKNALKF